MSCSRAKFVWILLGMLILIATIAFAGALKPSRYISETEYIPQEPMNSEGKDLSGRLAIYMVEPLSRWDDFGGSKYHNGFLGWAYNGNFNLSEAYPELNLTVPWDTTGYSNPSIKPGNLMAIAVVTDLSHGYEAYSDEPGGDGPPGGVTFMAYYTQATAAATIDSQWPNVVDTFWTHSVFVDVGTATWCPSCPAMNSAMHLAHIFYPDYPFEYAELITDMNTAADNWMDATYNLYWLPTAFFDGGYSVMIGSGGYAGVATSVYNAGQRAGLQMGLTLELVKTAKGDYEVTVACAENDFPGNASTPTGELAPIVDDEYMYTTSAIDPDDNDMYFKLMVNGVETDWFGPFASASSADIPYTFTAEGTYFIKAKAKDKFEFESDWSDSLEVEATSFVCDCIPGDADGSSPMNIFDITYIIAFLYKGGPAPTPYETCSGDPNGDCVCNIFDVTYVISNLYKGGPDPVTCEDWIAECGTPIFK